MKFRLWTAVLLAVMAAPVLAEDDAEGCKDHPLFNRMPGYRINACETKQFDSRDFPASSVLGPNNRAAKSETVEGVQTYIAYDSPAETSHASGLQIQRNYQNAVKAAGGVVVAEFGADYSGKQLDDDTWGGGDRATVLRMNKGNKEIWAWVHPYNGGAGYVLYIGEREAMQQAIVANELLDKINKDGYVALYINFDTAKASIKPDSQATLDQVAQMLKLAPDLKLEVGGHTDNVGKADANLKLSAARAESVIQALGTRGIAATRLSAKGYGDTKPTADNRTEAGRAQNRRVELTKR